eukprot:TRINITY_DN57997_c0_g2_i1.p1 TRINITY_DN57997_c0_g2~~TRINITY_DN57997_c0_g2_i1.p1  ORF type:complete len:374 (+),score=28.83 TRINITY_DN57997_c0_g2_i1:69-1190(+)
MQSEFGRWCFQLKGEWKPYHDCDQLPIEAGYQTFFRDQSRNKMIWWMRNTRNQWSAYHIDFQAGTQMNEDTKYQRQIKRVPLPAGQTQRPYYRWGHRSPDGTVTDYEPDTCVQLTAAYQKWVDDGTNKVPYNVPRPQRATYTCVFGKRHVASDCNGFKVELVPLGLCEDPSKPTGNPTCPTPGTVGPSPNIKWQSIAPEDEPAKGISKYDTIAYPPKLQKTIEEAYQRFQETEGGPNNPHRVLSGLMIGNVRGYFLDFHLMVQRHSQNNSQRQITRFVVPSNPQSPAGRGTVYKWFHKHPSCGMPTCKHFEEMPEAFAHQLTGHQQDNPDKGMATFLINGDPWSVNYTKKMLADVRGHTVQIYLEVRDAPYAG